MTTPAWLLACSKEAEKGFDPHVLSYHMGWAARDAEVESLKAELDALQFKHDDQFVELTRARAKLEALRNQEPVAWLLTETIYGLGGETWTESAVGTAKFHIDCEPLYLAAGAKEKTE
jgi:hypothetical protein